MDGKVEKSPLEDKLSAKAADILPYPCGNEKYVVDFSKGILSRFCQKFAEYATMKVESRGGTCEVSEADFQNYFDSLLYYRVCYAREERVNISRSTLKTVLIPAIFQLALNQIGRAKDRDTLIEFVPGMEKPQFLLGQEELRRVSDKLEILRDFGLELNPGFKFEPDGNLFFMTWAIVGDNFVREDRQAPKYQGVLHAFFEVQQMDGVIRPRIVYGLRSYYEDLLSTVIVDSFRR